MPTRIENFTVCVELRHADGSPIVGQVGKADAKLAIQKADPGLLVLTRDAGFADGSLRLLLAVPKSERPKGVYNRLARAAELAGYRVH